MSVPEWQNLLVDRRGSAGRITLNRPDARNPLDRTTADELLRALDRHFADPAVRSIVIDGAGDAFCAGGDLSEMKELPSLTSADAYDWPASIVAAHELMLDAPKPVIAAVHGPAYAGGMGLAAMCDIIIATSDARFALPEARLGLFPMIIVAHLARSLPRKRLLEMMFTGEAIDAKEALALGFVSRVVDDRDQLESVLDDYARRLARAAPNAVRLGRRAFSLLSDLPAEQSLRAARFLNVMFLTSAEVTEGATAFFERRSPSWTDTGGVG